MDVIERIITIQEERGRTTVTYPSRIDLVQLGSNGGVRWFVIGGQRSVPSDKEEAMKIYELWKAVPQPKVEEKDHESKPLVQSRAQSKSGRAKASRKKGSVQPKTSG